MFFLILIIKDNDNDINIQQKELLNLVKRLAPIRIPI